MSFDKDFNYLKLRMESNLPVTGHESIRSYFNDWWKLLSQEADKKRNVDDAVKKLNKKHFWVYAKRDDGTNVIDHKVLHFGQFEETELPPLQEPWKWVIAEISCDCED